jgi:hypothetical protein
MKPLSEKKPFALRKLALEVLVYGSVVGIYFLAVLRPLGTPLRSLSQGHVAVYALASLLLIVAQTLLLDHLTGWIVRRLYVEPLEEEAEE